MNSTPRLVFRFSDGVHQLYMVEPQNAFQEHGKSTTSIHLKHGHSSSFLMKPLYQKARESAIQNAERMVNFSSPEVLQVQQRLSITAALHTAPQTGEKEMHWCNKVVLHLLHLCTQMGWNLIQELITLSVIQDATIASALDRW